MFVLLFDLGLSALQIVFMCVSALSFFFFLARYTLTKKFHTTYFDRVLCILVADFFKVTALMLYQVFWILFIALSYVAILFPALSVSAVFNFISYMMVLTAFISSFFMYAELVLTLFLAIFFVRLVTTRTPSMKRYPLGFPLRVHIIALVSTIVIQIFRVTGLYVIPLLQYISRIYFLLFYIINVILMSLCFYHLIMRTLKESRSSLMLQLNMARFLFVVLSACVLGWFPMVVHIIFIFFTATISVSATGASVEHRIYQLLMTLSHLQLTIIVVSHNMPKKAWAILLLPFKPLVVWKERRSVVQRPWGYPAVE
ncbi:G-protein coupled receptors family 1 [Carpediemonas membranifera]|uniref:G-protein coupled receptors family 1 n=1 Tax=Carpediemonas membranifera TaxID=201153 RepID=A0A8J6AZ25_9EUKA|nr:G-protein coupled receptors family 1 [Carpediemonas membranifera]|eukprot:KAG9397543.1 G-protein coupled receptors family 1 [Carpediemonas membranifera]